MKQTTKRIGILAWLLLALLAPGCGYRVRSSVATLPEGIESIGIPVFQNQTSEYRVEQVLTDAVLQEFNLRTRMPVSSKKSGVDAVLYGDILEVSSQPVTFDYESFGSAYMVRVRISARLVRLKDSKVVWQNRQFMFQERYTLNNDVRNFFSEENPALERMARSFAASLVSAVTESQSIDSSKH